MLKHFILLFATVVGAAAAPVDEIEALLAFVGGLEGASFIRNGAAHTPAEAVSHLRMKWTMQKKQIASAEDFIRLCGTKSDMSGNAYLIRFPDAHEEEVAQVLLKQLKIIRADAACRSASKPKQSPEATFMPVTSPPEKEPRFGGIGGQEENVLETG